MGTVTMSTEEYKDLLCKNCNRECKEEVKAVEEIMENGYIVFNNKEQIEKYYNPNTHTYEFVKDGNLLDVKFTFDLDVKTRNIKAGNIKSGNIDAYDIDAYDIDAHNIDVHNINAHNINAHNINAHNIDAYDIIYYAYCIAYNNLKCKSIKGTRENSIHKCLDKDIEYIK